MRKRLPWKKEQIFIIVLALVTIIAGVTLLARHLFTDGLSEELVLQFGYIGVAIVGIIAGLNTIVPIPAATATPLFISFGLSFPLIILALGVGTIIADFVGYIIGHYSRTYIEVKYPKIFKYFTSLASTKKFFLVMVVFLYAAFVPFPNEAIIIPLALAGIHFRLMVIPLFIGNIINHTLIALGVTNIANLFS
jgi:membrane protein YqaA with SNARE-associated domain